MNDRPEMISSTEEEFLASLDLGIARPHIWDVGANVGFFAKECLKHWPDCILTCVEPNPHSIPDLTMRVGGRARIIEAALSDGYAHKPLYAAPGEPDVLASLHPRDWENLGMKDHMTRSYMVSTIPLAGQADWVDIDLLKLDIEGNELFALQGAGQRLDPQQIRHILWEFNSCNLDSRTYFRDFWNLLVPRGYKIGRVWGDWNSVHWIGEYTPALEDFDAHRDFVAVAA